MGVLWGMGYCTFKNMKLKLPPVSALVCRQFLRGVWLQSSSTILVDFYLTLRIYRWKEETLHPGVPMSQEQEEKRPQRGSWEKPEKQEHRSPANLCRSRASDSVKAFPFLFPWVGGGSKGSRKGKGTFGKERGWEAMQIQPPNTGNVLGVASKGCISQL